MKSWIPWVLLGLAAACSTERGSGRTNVLFVVVDSLRADEVSPEGTPALAGLAGEGVRFERAYATSSWNMPAVASLMTGAWPTDHGVVRIEDSLPPSVPTLASELARAGFATSAVVSDFRLGRSRGFDRGFEAFDAHAAAGDEAETTRAVVAQARAELERLAQDERPFLLFVHLYDPHASYLDHRELAWADPTGTSLRGGEPLEELRLIADERTETQTAFVRDLHREEVWIADQGLGALLAELAELGLDDETIVVATGSHGQELFERGSIGDATSLFEEQIHVPLVIRVPQGQRRIVTDPVSTAALAPTILEALGRAPIGVAASLGPLLEGRGRSIEGVVSEVDFKVPLAEDDRDVVQRSVVEKRFKLIRDERTGATRLYDLSVDPGERVDIARSYPGEVVRLSGTLDRHLSRLLVR